MLTLKNSSGILTKYLRFVDKANLKKERHQIEGIQWCSQRETSDVSYMKGGLIADEMGMGKTILMIGLIVCNVKKNTLVILPKQLLLQWEKEIKKNTNHTPYMLYGSSKVKNINKDIITSSPIILTTYGTLLSLGEGSVVHKFNFDRVIVDEAHRVRNSNTKAHQNIKNLSTDILWLLTGTPIQNKVQDLFRLFDLLKIPSEKYKDIKTLPDILKNYMLRREKNRDELNLPQLINKTSNIEWGSVEEMEKSKLFHQKFGDLSNSNSTLNDLYYSMNTNHLVATLHARMVCISPALLKNKSNKIYDTNIELFDETNEEFLNSTTKLREVSRTVAKNMVDYPSNKKLIFCHFHKEMEIIQLELYSYNIQAEIYSGKLSTKQRERLLNNSPDVLLVQINSGSEGLNLQQYNEVYFVSPTWNPSLEAQALARCYRMGQTKDTYVYRFYMNNFPVPQTDEMENFEENKTMDQVIQERQEEKLKVVDRMFSICNN